MVDACVIYVGVFLVCPRVFGDTSKPTGKPTFFVFLSVNNGNTYKVENNRKITDIWISKTQSNKSRSASRA